MSAVPLLAEPVSAARRLLGATLQGRGVRATIVEVEAYGGPAGGPWPDSAAHSFRGPTPRSSVMFGPAGRLYVYRSHGIHVCANVVCGVDGVAGAVLLRAAAITDGRDVAATRRRAGMSDAQLARGPGNLCEAIGISMSDNEIDLLSVHSPIRLELASTRQAACGPRVGVSTAADRPWRFWLPDEPAVSAYRRSPRAPKPGDSD